MLMNDFKEREKSDLLLQETKHNEDERFFELKEWFISSFFTVNEGINIVRIE